MPTKTLVDTDTGQILLNKSLTSPVVNGVNLDLQAGRIKFPVTQVVSGDPNTLDDYEEGTWTPSVGGTATYTFQLGTYTKIGNVVTVYCLLVINAIGSGSTSIISGLPFSAANNGVCGAIDFANLSQNIVYLAGVTSGTTLVLQSLLAAGASTTVNAVIGSNTTIRFQMTYLAS